MHFTILFWNIWLNNQLQGPEKSNEILLEIKKIIKLYQPDCIGLNEVLRHNQTDIPFVVKFISSFGYKYYYYAPSSPITKDWLIGCAIISKLPLNNIEEILLGYDYPAKKRGYNECTVKAIAAQVTISNNKIGIITAHPIYLSLSTIKSHYKHTKTLISFLKRKDFSVNTIIGGDFNEPRLMPKSFTQATKKFLNHKTGNILNPTWQYQASNTTPLRTNLDKIFWTKKGTLKLENFYVIKSKVSDHKPLLAIFNLPV